MKPNIFDIATKELHQDAFVVWLLQWAEPENRQFDESLNLCGQEFVRLLILTQYNDNIKAIYKIESGRQWKGIDVWAEVRADTGSYLIIIEDKTFSVEHSGQLSKYKKIGEGYCLEKDLKMVCIYLKTGSEPERDLAAIRSKGFSTFGRKQFIELLLSFDNIQDNIFNDFKERLIRLDASYNAFETTCIEEWTDACWIGFYEFLEKEIGLVLWHYVYPPGGDGFWNACLNWEDWNGFPVYLQIEQGKLCFKIATHSDVVYFDGEFDRREKRNGWYNIIIAASKEAALSEVRKPDRFGTGNYMTVAVIDKDVWLGSPKARLEKDRVIERLKMYKEFLKSVCRQHSKKPVLKINNLDE